MVSVGTSRDVLFLLRFVADVAGVSCGCGRGSCTSLVVMVLVRFVKILEGSGSLDGYGN